MTENNDMPDVIYALHNEEYIAHWSPVEHVGNIVSGNLYKGVKYIRASLVPATVTPSDKAEALRELPLLSDYNGMDDDNSDQLFAKSFWQWYGKHSKTIRSALQEQDSDLVRALTKCRDRFFPINQPERDRDIDWDLVNDALKHKERS